MYKFVSELNLDDSTIHKMDTSQSFKYVGGFYMYDPQQIEIQIPEGESSTLSDLAHLSFNSYDCENQMIADMKREFTEEKLSNIFNSECPEKAFNDAASRIIEKYN
ncbi:hypothetical protein [Bacillus atrophaeus]|uniref:hypothetical protein n=1 Tax=Bacillus atrophaeus TaxID=1452 RepID=UPI00228273D3|nr:hypothetical protein [Bacillus atrophaeus]MCY8958184.1 hypothetical protein [Bacillus atrophaeus]MCY8963757.1 hypothetical protein [Bacillus atrophaeus]MCY9161181.1 hypothetical protein [Bacillus atrophaeus]MCY9440223.1 hypothetical protein [Bacillus atrophaeus]MEC0648503.1 hypothetical protein [Bacillus atrophaeus]